MCHVTRHYLKKKSLYVYAVYVSCLCRQPGFVSFNASIRLECSSLQTSHIHLLNLKPIYSPLKLHTLHIHLRICLANFWVSQIWKNMQFDKEKVELTRCLWKCRRELFDKIHYYSCLLRGDEMKMSNTRDISSLWHTIYKILYPPLSALCFD